MPWPLLRLSLRARLYLVCALLIVLLLAPSYYTLRQVGRLRDITFEIQDWYTPTLLMVGRMEASLADLDIEVRGYVADPGPERQAAVQLTLDIPERDAVQLSAGPFTDWVAPSLAAVESLTTLVDRVDSLVSNRRGPEATALLDDEWRTVLADAKSAFGAFGAALFTDSEVATTQAQAISRQTARTAAAATGLVAGLAVLLALFSVGTVTNPLSKLRSAMAAVAGGRFSPPNDLAYGRADEIGDLSRSFRSMAERLAELDRLKAEFVSIASHELKTPLNVVRGYVEMMEDGTYGEISPSGQEALGYIREQTEVIRERVDQLLAMSRLEAQGLEVQLAPVVLADLFEEIRRNFAGVAAQQRIVFRVQPDASVPDVALLDHRRVRDELLGNLLGNAFKFTPKGGAIYVRAWGEPGWLIFQIRDTGEGIPPAQLPYVFEKYYQAGQHAGKIGAGLGLAIAREIVEAHGGRISVESRQGTGSVFRVELPALAQSGPTDAPSHLVAAPAGLRANGGEEGARKVAGGDTRPVALPLPEAN